MELELDGVHGVSASLPDGVGGARVVAEAGVDAVEDAVPDHEDLADEGLLGRAAEDLHGTLDLVLLDGFLDRDAGSHGGCGVAVVTASVAWRPLLEGLLVRHGLVGYPREGVELPHEGYDGASRAVCCDEGRGHPGDPLLDVEAVLLQDVDHELGRLVLLQADLGVLPDGLVDVGEELLVLLDPVQRALFLLARHYSSQNIRRKMRMTLAIA